MDVYNVNNYSDSELYDILDMNHPTDRELEAKLIQMIRKYEDIPSDVGKQLYTFFDNIYKRFFDDPDDDDTIIEGMTATTAATTAATPTPTPLTYMDPSNTIPPSGNSISQGYRPQTIASVQNFEYSADKLQLNPLLKQTIKRVISVDSQYRNISTYPTTTSFSFDLSEPLRDVVSLKLYSVQIPFTWYTIGKSYGSNFFYLRGNAPGITDNAYQIKIAPGNYTQETLINTINRSFYDISNGAAADINFNGQTLIAFGTSDATSSTNTSAKTTVNLNIQNTFNDTYYSLNFPYFTHPVDTTGNNTYSIPGYLGFNNETYPLNSIQSSYKQTIPLNDDSRSIYYLNEHNSQFTVIQYVGYDQFSGYDSRSDILKTIPVVLQKNGFTYATNPGYESRQNIINAVNQAIKNAGYTETDATGKKTTHLYFDPVSKIQQIDITDVSNQNFNNSYFQLNLTLNRKTLKYVPNAKIIVLFPNETPVGTSNTTIWQLQTPNPSCFFFDNSMNDFSQFVSESPAIQSTFTIDTSTNMIMTCTTPGYNTDLSNNFNMNVQTGIYNMTQFLNAITNSFSNQNTPTNPYFDMTTTTAFLDSSDFFNLQINMTKSFTNPNYAVIIDGNSFLKQTNNFDISYSIVSNNILHTDDLSYNIQDISYINLTIPKIYTGYQINSTQLLNIRCSTKYGNGGNRDAPDISANLPQLTYGTYDSLLKGLQTAFTNTTVTTPVNTQTPLSTTVLTINQSYTDHIDISLNINCYYSLNEANYDISFVDASYDISSVSSAWYKFNIDSNYHLSSNTSGYAVIKGYNAVDKQIIGSITLYDNCNNTLVFETTNTSAPTDIITVTIPAGTYTSGPLITALNTALYKNPKTYGSYFQTIIQNNDSYTYLWTNINHVYTTQDYILDFYDPINFVSCFVGASSVQNTTWDSTVGWILGFRDYTQYFLTPQNQTITTSNPPVTYYQNSINGSYIISQIIDPSSNLLTGTSISLTSDTSLTTQLYNYFLISLDDYIQNHLNDGLVTITRSQTSVQVPDSANTTTLICDPATNQLVARGNQQSNSDNANSAQLYSINQSIISQANPPKQYSPGPFIKDLFGIVPIKPPSKPGDYYTEFGGTLQNQERLYFGPVNIRKMSIQLLTDRGTVVDLNNSNWSFSFVCEQLYRASSS